MTMLGKEKFQESGEGFLCFFLCIKNCPLSRKLKENGVQVLASACSYTTGYNLRAIRDRVSIGLEEDEQDNEVPAFQTLF